MFKMSGDHLDLPEMVHRYPDHIRKHIVDILKTGDIDRECIAHEDILFYLEVCYMSPTLKVACEEKLLDSVGTQNCFQTLELAEKFELLLVRKEIISQIVGNFQCLWRSECFLHQSENTLEIICQIDAIAKHCDIFLALRYWLDLKHEHRFQTYCKLIEIVQKKRTAHKHSNANTYHAMFMMASTSKHSIVTTVFNSDGDVVCHRNLFRDTEIKDNFSVACVQKDERDAPYVYFCSGKHVLRYDPILNKHNHCDHLIHTRNESSLVSIGDYLYTIGGHHHGKIVREIEELDTKQHRNKLLKKTSWKTVSMIPENIHLLSAPCVVYENKIYIIGQITNHDQISTAIIVFDPENKSIQNVAEYPKASSECKAVVQGSYIFIACSDGLFLRFDPNANIFASCTDLPNTERNFGIYAEENSIYTVGGTSCNNGMGLFEKDEYDIQTNTWKRKRELSCDLPVYGYCDIKVPSCTSVIPFYDTRFKEIKS